MPAVRTYTGAIHLHTDRTDNGGASLQDIVDSARQNGIDFIVLCDHGTRGYAKENLEGWQDGILVLCGEEVATPQGHVLAFETRDSIGKKDTLEAGLAEIRSQVGTVVSVHHQLAGQRGMPPPLPIIDGDMVEIWSFMDEFLSRATSKNVMQHLSRPDKLITGPSRKLLWQWDRALEKRRTPAIGGLNAHCRKHPLLDWKLVFPYHVMFQTICTVIQTPDLPSVSLRARDLVWQALREGRSYIVNRSVGPEKGFRFEYVEPGGRVRGMGEDHAYVPGGRMHMRVPMNAELVLRHNGQPIFWGTASDISFPAPMPGSYRVEVMLNRRTWILSNAIRLVDEDQIIQPTVSDVT